MILSVDAGDFTEPGVDTIDACIRQKDCEEMADKIIEELPEIYAAVVRLRFFYGLEIVEIAEIRCTYTHDGSFGRKGFWVLQETSREMINNYVESYEQSMIGDMEALVLTPQMTDSTSTYRQVIYLFNSQDMVLLMVGSDDPQLSAEELKKLRKV